MITEKEYLSLWLTNSLPRSQPKLKTSLAEQHKEMETNGEILSEVDLVVKELYL